MIIRTSKSFLPLIVLFAIGLTSCATTNIKPPASVSVIVNPDITYQVKSGDRLSGIARRFTGQVDNWEVIAAANNITDPRTLAAGETITIPGALIPPATPTTAAHASSVRESSASSGYSRSPLSVTPGNGVSVARSQPTPIGETAAITVFPVRVNRTFDLQPLDAQTAARNRMARGYDSAAPQIKVLGTYYPKGIYAEPANYSRLIRRAAPGTVFMLESEVHSWYKIVTEQGVGYIRQSDSTLVD